MADNRKYYYLKLKAGEFVSKHKKAFLIVGGIGLLLVMLLGLLQSCSSIFGGGVSNIVASSYLSENSDLLAAEAAYCAMEDELREYLDAYEQTHDYDEYHFDLDEIKHDPYVLLSILSSLHEGQFTIDQVQDDLHALSFDCCTIWHEVDFRNRSFFSLCSFGHIQSPSYILQFLFSAEYVLCIHIISLNNSHFLSCNHSAGRI